ncbi:MAG: sulfotransferase [Rubrobacter sp.]|nr:sulfotransferase [Rubrobacter sp.]
MTLPNFAVIGAAKSGTTALYEYLKQHPDVYMSPQKETNFFAFEGREVGFRGPGDEGISQSSITEIATYRAQFAGVAGETAIGEASPWYLYLPGTAGSLRRHVPDARLIVLLRNPVDRAFSSYLHLVKDGREKLSFEEGLEAEEARIEQGWEPLWHYKRAGLYTAQVKRFLELFGRNRMRFYLYDDFAADVGSVVKDVYEYLDVDSSFLPDTSTKHNITGVPRNRLLWRLLRGPNLVESTAKLFIPPRLQHELKLRVVQGLLKKPVLRLNTRRELARGYRKDVLHLQDLIGLDLSRWIEE